MAARKKDPEKIQVAPVEPMLIQHFRLHVQTRHPQMRFRTKNEHAADHRLHREVLDHVHTEAQSREEEEANAEG